MHRYEFAFRELHDTILEIKDALDEDVFRVFLGKSAAIMGRWKKLKSGASFEPEFRAAMCCMEGDSHKVKVLAKQRLGDAVSSLMDERSALAADIKAALLAAAPHSGDTKSTKRDWVGSSSRGPGPSQKESRPHGRPPPHHGGTTHSQTPGIIKTKPKK